MKLKDAFLLQQIAVINTTKKRTRRRCLTKKAAPFLFF
ncbi:hypothetical protein DHBDCA_p1397 [Dehalobacter sp. DCA]|nr:hypothetical protein DHBDCA_p1397 [Dehalobacter sp. DCA]